MTDYGIKALKTKVKHGDILSAEEKNFIIKELEKRYPRNVIWKLQSKDKGTNNYKCFCPFCNTKLSPYEHHCKCGQALIWSKEN